MEEPPNTTTSPGGTEPPEPQQDDHKPHRLGRRPKNVRDVFMVLAGHLGREHLRYAELGYYRAHGHDGVRRQVIADVEANVYDEGWVLEALNERDLMLRPVPAQSWPKDAEPSGYENTRRLVV